jgi:hypothetical protein
MRRTHTWHSSRQFRHTFRTHVSLARQGNWQWNIKNKMIKLVWRLLQLHDTLFYFYKRKIPNKKPLQRCTWKFPLLTSRALQIKFLFRRFRSQVIEQTEFRGWTSAAPSGRSLGTAASHSEAALAVARGADLSSVSGGDACEASSSSAPWPSPHDESPFAGKTNTKMLLLVLHFCPSSTTY